MRDNIMASITGTMTSLLSMLTGLINVTTAIEVIFYGLIGGAAGMIGKWIIVVVRHHTERIFRIKK
ncbi:MAG: hypothetical protein R2764_01505 [Bacteroidales bacterium]